jgi:O-antigen ligase
MVLDLNNTTFSILMRCLAFFASIVLMFVAVRIHDRLAFSLFLVFWVAYFFRLYISQFIIGELTTFLYQTYWIWGVGASFVPGLLVLARYRPTWSVLLRSAFLYVSLIATILLLSGGGTSNSTAIGEMNDQGRWNVTSLNPISMGHLGVSTLLIGIGFLRAGNLKGNQRLLVFAAIGLGALLTLFANSRGPIISLLAAFSLMLLASARQRRTWWLILALLLATTAGAGKIADILFSSNGIIDRFSAISEGDDLSSAYRLIAFNGAWNQFLQNPLFGNAVEEQITQYYPHNLVLEALMATGLIGGIPFIGLLFLALHAALKIMSRAAGETWIGLLTIQYIVASLFSGSLAQATPMWIMIALSTTHYAAMKGTRRSKALPPPSALVRVP